MLIKTASLPDANELERIYSLSFESNGPYFPADMEEDEDAFSFQTEIAHPDKHVLGFWVENRLAGGAIISRAANGTNLLEKLFILPDEQGKGYGYLAWSEIEKTHPCEGGWMLRTPTCLINNVCFYVNKCGFSIIRVEDMGKDGVGMYVFFKPADWR
ncbi:GNAT family N-acetyltransferase [Pectobacterium versatile]|uniref:GNAT family N-acetyltransferase n=1 Tax=Pectobacterium versatile TaxID=2488639 RepID=UPI001CCB08B2|nr:GNAT family N-acetyltransferase [Pectobacterium versatile]